MKKLLFLRWCAAICLLLGATAAQSKEMYVKFQTERSQGEQITITVATIGSLAVDWGDGVRESVKPGKITGVLKGTQVTVYGDEFLHGLDVSDCGVKIINFASATSLQFLKVADNALTSFVVSSLKNLRELDCSGNRLTTLSITSNTQLQYLDCRRNELTTLTATGLSELRTLLCDDNALTSLNCFNENLTDLWCTGNKLSRLTMTGNDKLNTLLCSGNSLGSISLTGLSQIENLWCSNGRLSNLNLSDVKSLKTLDCSENRLTQLTIGGLSNTASAYYINCSGNKLQLNSIYPASYAQTYEAMPQDTIDLKMESAPVKENIDFSDYLVLANGAKNTASITIYNKDTGEELSRGMSQTTNDYYVMSGKVKFWKPFNRVFAVITTKQFPNLAIPTTAFRVIDPTGINSATEDAQGKGDIHDLLGRYGQISNGFYIQNGKVRTK